MAKSATSMAESPNKFVTYAAFTFDVMSKAEASGVV
jgi:hypothetical protein